MQPLQTNTSRLVLVLCCAALLQVQCLRVMTYNIQSGSGFDQKYNLTRQAQVMRDAQAEIIALQEVDNRTLRHDDDQTLVLSNLTGLHHWAYAKMRNFQGGGYGIAILSKYRILQTVEYHFKNKTAEQCVVYKPDDFCQGVLAIQVAVSSSDSIWYVTTHLGLQGVQAAEAEELVQFLSTLQKDNIPLFITGDFNSAPESVAVQALLKASFVDSWRECGSGDGYTFNSKEPFERIDYVFHKNAEACVNAQVLNSQASDHRPVVVQF